MRPSNDEYYLSMLDAIAARSTCPRRQVGAIIVTEDHRILSTGFNGVPRGFPHCTEEHKQCPGANDPKGDTRRCLAVHAELNAVLSCADLSRAHTLYVKCTPCKQCALMICNTPIKRIVCRERYADDSADILRTANVTVEVKPL